MKFQLACELVISKRIGISKSFFTTFALEWSPIHVHIDMPFIVVFSLKSSLTDLAAIPVPSLMCCDVLGQSSTMFERFPTITTSLYDTNPTHAARGVPDLGCPHSSVCDDILGIIVSR